MAETKRKSAPKKKAAVEAAIPVESRGTRKAREGIVASNTMAKTVVVKIERRIPHALYGKVVKRTGKFKAHDEIGCDVGDRVEIVETRPMSREKRWRVSRILEKVK